MESDKSELESDKPELESDDIVPSKAITEVPTSKGSKVKNNDNAKPKKTITEELAKVSTLKGRSAMMQAVSLRMQDPENTSLRSQKNISFTKATMRAVGIV